MAFSNVHYVSIYQTVTSLTYVFVLLAFRPLIQLGDFASYDEATAPSAPAAPCHSSTFFSTSMSFVVSLIFSRPPMMRARPRSNAASGPPS
ncbi:hypothetical protein CQG20_24130 [Salmonella enterica subsp. enterica serovar Typhimurium]|nr:hypothetical protein [Salmonella enterica subsp. enterica serovar Typhimurium]HAF2089503.1 hypothetical protein [Salmonella enterica]ECP4816897.1 hypothetical protein [Salmonella enterica subsp. enterica serovar Typhimurium]ECY4361136.1 hypothetical protein [Salmonella enterica subsp. enterica serovar Typhimurium]ECY5371847.1 hypothetical protein [Salmonella enterica subsp. enterica serovar Typhimurium]